MPVFFCVGCALVRFQSARFFVLTNLFERFRFNLANTLTGHAEFTSYFFEGVVRSINETMSRTILTAGATFIVCLLMFFMGGGVIHDFFFALSLGIISGTYSTIFIASPITIWLDKLQAKRTGSPKVA